jgi:hypothetical protein
MRRPVVLLSAALCCFSAACSDGSGPDEPNLQGQDFPLFEIGMSQLPVLDKTTAFGAQLWITEGTLRILSKDRVLFVTKGEYRNPINPSEPPTPISPESLVVAYTRSGDQFLLPFASGPNGPYTDTITIMNGFLRASRFRAHREGQYLRKDYIYLTQ